MVLTTGTALVTAADLPALSSGLARQGKRTELVRGDLIVMTPAGGRHGQVAHRVTLVIGNHVLNRNLGRVFAAETGFLLHRNPDTVRAPDVAFVAGDRLGAGETPTGFLEMAPDLAVEVISPSDTATAVRAKVDDWLEAGTRLVWVVDPETRAVVVHRPARPAAVVPEPAILPGAPVLSAFSVPVRDLFT